MVKVVTKLDISRLEQAIAGKGWKVPYFCSLMGKDRRYVTNIKAGRSNPGPEVIEKMADILDTTVAYLIGESDKKEKPRTITGTEQIANYNMLTDEHRKTVDDMIRFLLERQQEQ